MPFIGNQPAKVPLTSADITDNVITSAKIVDSTIVNADIANSTINLTQKVTGSLPVANGGTGLTALGTASQVLRVNSGATALEFGTVSSDYVRLATTTISSAVSSVEITTGFSDTYPLYVLHYYGVTNATNNISYKLQFGTGGTPTYSTSTYYGTDFWLNTNTDSPSPSLAGGNAITDGILLSSPSSVWNSTNFSLNGYIMLYNLRSTATLYKGGMVNSINFQAGTQYPTRSLNLGYSGSTTVRDNAVTAIKVLTSSGNMNTGTFVLYGIKTA